MEDDIYIFPTAAGFLTRFTDFQRENPDRFVVNISTGENGSGDDLYIEGYDTASGLSIDFFISAIGDEFRFLTTNPNEQSPPQEGPPPSDDFPFFDIPEFITAHLPDMFAFGGFDLGGFDFGSDGPVDLLPISFLTDTGYGFNFGGGYGSDFGGGYGFDFGGGGGGSDSGHFLTDSLDAQFYEDVGYIY